MEVGQCGGGASNISAQSMMNQQDALDFQKEMNPNTAYAAQQAGGAAQTMARIAQGSNPGSTQSVGQAGMNGGMNHGGMNEGEGGRYGGIPMQHSGTDHLMQSGLMMEGDMAQDFSLNNADGNYDLSSHISGNKYVVQDVVERVMEDRDGLASRAANGNTNAMNKLENAVAKELTNVNDVEDIENDQLRDAFLAEARSYGMNDKEIDHLLHTPISETGAGGMIDGNSEITGALHTVDLDRTRAVDMGDGTYEVHLVSNNGKNNAHDNMDISTFYTQANSADQAVDLVNDAAERGDLDANGRYNLTDAGMNIMMSNLSNYV